MKNDKCACRGSFLERFVQPSIMMLLVEEDLHGFSILKKLYGSNIMDFSTLDPTGLYRTLKKMEEAGLLSSCLDTQNPMQPKRVYSLTKEGRICLIFWKDTLIDYGKRIDKLTGAVAEAIKHCPEYCDGGAVSVNRRGQGQGDNDNAAG